jgi:hypothetical protein
MAATAMCFSRNPVTDLETRCILTDRHDFTSPFVAWNKRI